ncbi:MAG TPA: aldehyde dehydrogenase family protein [Segeticoccus sp.]|uniref:aldehyde dehydrogenase family protein n=1 Tax=Segeticoccus sp. TaxID=2706531 RepID=UPI002D7FF9F6|nr:aldehyde dehydrogenase family protein [Segeticoccus sp.]HET8600767.1 aldehyde dehydrogenase family protein [Segeticoccus sp.]
MHALGDADYRTTTNATAQGMTSVLHTARLAADTWLQGRSTTAYADTMVTHAEQACGDIVTTYDSRQPPPDVSSIRLKQRLHPPSSRERRLRWAGSTRRCGSTPPSGTGARFHTSLVWAILLGTAAMTVYGVLAWLLLRPALGRPPVWGTGTSGKQGGMTTPATAVSNTSADSVGNATASAVEAALAGADGAREAWRHTDPGERAAALRQAADRVRERVPELADLLCDATGRLHREARASVEVAADLLEEAAVRGLAGTGRSLAGSAGAMDVVRAEPRGVVAVLTPWNDPYPAAAGLLAAALVTGNTVVHKPSERCTAAGLALADCLRQCLPEGVLTVVTGDGGVGAQLVQDERVQLVAHIGSTRAGREIRRVVGARGASAIVENGGKDPILVDAGVDPVWAAEQIALGAFTNAGQLCTSVERVYLHTSIASATVRELVRIAESLRPGDPRDPDTTLCRLVDERQLAVVAEHVDQARSRGALCLTGGARLDRDGSWYAPTVLTGCTDDMLVMTEETFGPVAPVQEVDSWETGLRLARSSEYGLAATVLTPDTRHALEAADELQVGTVKVNAVFGGAPGGSADPRGASGDGCGFGPDLLREMVALKAVHLESVPSH